MDAELVKLILWIIGTIVGVVWGWAKARYHLKEGKKAKLIEITEKAVLQIYEEFVREAKALSEDGKLSMEDITLARGQAWNRACDIAKGHGIDFAKEVSLHYFPVIIDKIIKSVKKN